MRSAHRFGIIQNIKTKILAEREIPSDMSDYFIRWVKDLLGSETTVSKEHHGDEGEVYKIDSKIKGRDKDYLWKISEVFNSVIESWNPYYKIFKFKTPPYTGKNIYTKMRRQWIKNPDIDELLDGWLKYQV